VEKPALTVTPDAWHKIGTVRERAGHPDACLHIAITGRRSGRFVYQLDLVDPQDAPPGDIEVDLAGLRVLMDHISATHLDGATIAYDDSRLGGALRIDNPNEGWADPIAGRVQAVLDEQINPAIAAHGGYVDLLNVENGTAYIAMGGGCQGCAQVSVTLGQGVEVAIKAAVPEVTRIVDTTDHAAGTNPYYQASKK